MDNYIIHLRAQGLSEQSITTRRFHLRRIQRHLGKPLAQASGAELEEYLANAGTAREYKRSLLASLRSYFRYLNDTGQRADNPTTYLARIKPEEPHAQPAPDIAYYTALKHADTRDALMIQLAAIEGMRRAEVAKVHENDLIDDLFGFSLIVHGKGGKTRTLPITRELARELQTAFAQSPNGYAFPGRDGGHLSPAYVGKRVSRLLPEGYSMHSLRHRAATNIHRRGKDMLLTQKFLGHASPVTTQRYVHQDMEELRALIGA